MQSSSEPTETDSPPDGFSFPVGSEYTLPPGVKLDGLDRDGAIWLATLVRQYYTVFAKNSLNLGRCDLIPHEIRVTDATPVKQQIQGLLEQGLIRRIVPVRKTCGALHLCVDYQQLNSICLKDAFALPCMH